MEGASSQYILTTRQSAAAVLWRTPLRRSWFPRPDVTCHQYVEISGMSTSEDADNTLDAVLLGDLRVRILLRRSRRAALRKAFETHRPARMEREMQHGDVSFPSEPTRVIHLWLRV